MAKVLVVEDDKYLASAYQMKLSKAGFTVDIAGNGDEALADIRLSRPDLILLDLVMPVRDGFSVLEELKKSPLNSKIPVIISSNLGQKDDLERAMKLGALDYIVKSDTSLDMIIQKINKAITEHPR